jgi:hypothetical protein
VRCLLATLHADVNSFDFSASTLRDFIEFENIELSFAADITFFPRTDVAVNWTPSFEAEFDPENVFRVLKQQVIDQAEDYMSVSACVLACLRACFDARRGRPCLSVAFWVRRCAPNCLISMGCSAVVPRRM